MIQAKNIWKTYQIGRESRHVLRDLNLNITAGELVAILGPSGAGKTTLLNLLSGLDSPTKGEVLLGERSLTNMGHTKRQRFLNGHVGFVFQFFHLIADLTALENIVLPARMHGKLDTRKAHSRAKELLAGLGLEERKHDFPLNLSGGERQRVAIARALINDPQIIFCDEPTGNLDSQTGQEVCDYLCHLSEKERKTVLIVTHDDRISEVAKRTLYLRDGQWACAPVTE